VRFLIDACLPRGFAGVLSNAGQEWIAADEAAAESDDQTAVIVPNDLLPEIRRLLASHRTA
jgi:predicted nuclease of predicted toxin-antitoxin system